MILIWSKIIFKMIFPRSGPSYPPPASALHVFTEHLETHVKVGNPEWGDSAYAGNGFSDGVMGFLEAELN
jgi:hypothetical protein